MLGAMSGCKKAEQPDGAKSGVLLKVKWPAGNRYVYRLEMDQHTSTKMPQMPKPVEQHVVMGMTYALSVLKEQPDGGRELEMEFQSIELEITGAGQNLHFNSKDAPSTNDVPNPAMEPFRNIIGAKVQLELNAAGNVDKVIGLEDFSKLLASEEGGQGAQMMTQMFNEGFFRQMADFGHGMPAKPVAVGESWPFKMEMPVGGSGKIVVEAKTKLTGWQDYDQRHCTVLDAKGTLKGTIGPGVGPMGKMTLDHGQVTSTSWFDPELGAMIASTSDQSMRIKGDMPGQRNVIPFVSGLTVDLTQKISLKLAELGKTGE